MDIILYFWLLYFVAQIIPALAMGSPVGRLLCSFDISPLVRLFCCCLSFKALPQFLVLPDTSGSSCVFPAPVRESSLFFYWRIALKPRSGCQVCLLVLGYCFFLVPSQLTKHRNACLFTKLCTYTYPYVTIFILRSYRCL